MYQALLTGRAAPLQNKREILEQLSLLFLMCLRMKGRSLWQQWGPAVAQLSKKTAVRTAKPHLLLCNYCKELFTHCVEEKDGLTFSSVFFQSINGINFSLKRMSDKIGAYGKTFLLQRNTHRTACAQNWPALTPHVQQNPRLTGWNDTGQSQGLYLSSVPHSRSGCLWEILPAGAGTAEGACARLCEMEFWASLQIRSPQLSGNLPQCPHHSYLNTFFFLVYFGIFAATIQSCCLLFFCYVPLSNPCFFFL